jgi:DNA-binding NarL/FixJ family response regulator
VIPPSADCAARPGRSGPAGQKASTEARGLTENVTVVLGLDAILTLGVATLLRSERRLSVMECGTGSRALDDALSLWEPNVIVLGEEAQPATVERLRTVRRSTTVLVIAYDPTYEVGMGLLAAGANCLSRNADEVDVLDAVARTGRGERFFIPANGAPIYRIYPSDAARLTEREQEVLAHLAEGRSYRLVARKLNISLRTVHTHAAAILRKLGMNEKQDLIGLPIPVHLERRLDTDLIV